jgi:Uma2 family endonuclease
MTMQERETHPATDAGERKPSEVETTFEAVSATVPEGWRVELIEGDIHVVPPANGEHEEIVSILLEQMVLGRKDRSLRFYTGIGLRIPWLTEPDRFVPDLVIAPKGSFADELEYHDPEPVLLVCEVTSKSTRNADRAAKLRAYARAGIPCYLLIDRKTDTATLFSDPAEGSYEQRLVVKIGKALALPEPLGFDLDTGEMLL